MQSGHIGEGSTFATATTADGSIVIGDANGQQAAFIWDTTHGMRTLADALEQDYGFDLSGFGLDSANGISADGNYIVGFTGEYGERVGCLISLPEPRSFVAAFSVLVGASLRRQRVP